MNKFTIGIEEEYMVVNPITRELTSHQQKITQEASKFFGEGQVKAEMHQAVVEVGTTICRDSDEARIQISKLRLGVSQVANSLGYRIGAAGTHPFSDWLNQSITQDERYLHIINELQDIARSNLIYGLHVHVGFDSREMSVHIANQMRYFLPHVFALSTNSPFWQGRNTGYASYRTKIFDKFPRTGIPDRFESFDAYERYVNILIKTGCIDNAKKIWWDLRVHPFYNTIEFRVCDCPMNINETICIASIFQALCKKLYKLRMSNLEFINYHRALINENKWRAARYGVHGKLIDFGKEAEVPYAQLILELLDFIDDVVDDLGCRQDVEYAKHIVANGSGADRQLTVYKQTGNFISVVDYIIEQTVQGLST